MLKLFCQPAIDDYELLVLPFWEGGHEAADLKKWKELLKGPLASGDFKGKSGDTLVLYEKGRILLLGLGKKENISADGLRRAYSTAVRAAQAKKVKSIHLVFPNVLKMDHEEVLSSIAEGVFLSNYAFTSLKGDSLKENPVVLLEKVHFVGLKPQDEKILHKLMVISSGVHLARDLINGNADEITPQKLAETALSLSKSTPGLKAHVLDKKAIEKEKMGLLLAVNRGSSLEPRLIELSYQGNPKSKEHIVLIGKGLTYDTGGLSLKPTDSMLTMKDDMSGAAAVLSTVHTAAALKLKVNVTALVPSTENAIDAKSYKIGDVYRSMCGKTVEITNTDAEGRLILADAISYAVRHLKPTMMIDLATLTGAIVVALGEEMAGLFTNHDAIVKELMASSKATGENLWRIPLYADYKEMLKSDIADMVNSAAGRSASSITAALFLQEFCDKIPWAHIDIAGTAYQSKPKYYNVSKATGFGVRLLIDFLERRPA